MHKSNIYPQNKFRWGSRVFLRQDACVRLRVPFIITISPKLILNYVNNSLRERNHFLSVYKFNTVSKTEYARKL